MLRDITLTLAVLGIVPGVGFTVLYGSTSPWWRSAGGRHLMSFSLGATMLFLWWSLEFLVGSYPGRQVLRLVLAVSFVGLMWWRFLVLLHLHFGVFQRHFHEDGDGEGSPRRRKTDLPPGG